MAEDAAPVDREQLERLDLPGAPSTPGGVLRLFYRHPSPWLLTLAAVGAVSARALTPGWSAYDAAVGAAVVAAWPLQEWLIHVGILHWRPRRLFGLRVDPLAARKHREHHADPWRADVVFIPPGVALVAAPLVGLAWWAALPSPLWLTGLAAYLLLALHYEWVHLLVHTQYRPRTWLYKRLWRHHRLHHFKNEHFWFGVTMTSGDALLGTRPAAASVPTSDTCRTLGIEPEDEPR